MKTDFPYENREVSWLKFNERVLEEAQDLKIPLLERLLFIRIFYSNLDEFYMVRVAELKEFESLDIDDYDKISNDNVSTRLKGIRKTTQRLIAKADRIYNQIINDPLLKSKTKGLHKVAQLNKLEREQLANYFEMNINPFLTIRKIDTTQTMPTLGNQKMYIAALLEDERMYIISYPRTLDRLIQVSDYKFVLLEDVISHFFNLIKHGDITVISSFRVLRSMIRSLTYDYDFEESEELFQSIQEQLEKRKKGVVVGVQIESDEERRNENIIKRLKRKLGIKNLDVYEFPYTPIDTEFIFELISKLKPMDSSLTYATIEQNDPKQMDITQPLFNQIRLNDIYVEHPYESFEKSVISFLAEAATDEKVTEIFITIYRLHKNSKILDNLKLAITNGKKVNVIVELKARFDEANNLQAANELKKLNCKLIFSQEKIKVHGKVILVKRALDNNNIEYLTHIGTGNYHEGTAKLYGDVGIFTADKLYGQDVECFFYGVEHALDTIPLDRLYASPHNISLKILNLIDQEIIYHHIYGGGKIILKVNSLYYKEIIDRLYYASQQGVQINLIVRGICGLRGGIPGISDNITVRSIVGRYLEHARIYYFRHNNNNKLFISSADLMGRNLLKRYEILTPIKDPRIVRQIKDNLELSMKDNVKQRIQQPDGSFKKIISEEPALDYQLEMFK